MLLLFGESVVLVLVHDGAVGLHNAVHTFLREFDNGFWGPVREKIGIGFRGREKIDDLWFQVERR